MFSCCFYRPQTKFAKVMFSRVSVWGSLPWGLGIHPPRDQRQTHTPGGYYGIRSTSERYASHSNAFLFKSIFKNTIFYFQFSPCTIFNFISLLCASFLFLYSAFLLDSVIINNERPFPQYRYNITTEPVSIFLSSGGSRI